MEGMIVFRPGERTSAAEVARSEWMVKWALPDLEIARRHWSEA